MHCPMYMYNKQSWEPADHVTQTLPNCDTMQSIYDAIIGVQRNGPGFKWIVI